MTFSAADVLRWDQEAPAWDARTPPILKALLALADSAAEAAFNAALQAAPVALYGDPEAWWSRLILQAHLSAAPEALLDTWSGFGVAVDGAVRHAKQMAEEGRVREAGDAYWRALPAAERFGHPIVLTQAWLGLSGVASQTGDVQTARQALLQAHAWVKYAEPRRWGLMAELVEMGAVLANEAHDFRRARARLKLALVLAKRENHPAMLARLHRDVGVLANQTHRLAEAETAFREALTWAHRADDPALVAAVTSDLANHLAHRRRFGEARALLGRAIEMPGLSDADAADVRLNAAKLEIRVALDDQGTWERAARLLCDAISLRTRGGAWALADLELADLAWVRLNQGLYDASRLCLTASLRAARHRGRRSSLHRDECDLQAMSLRLAQNRLSAAERYARRAIDQRLRGFKPQDAIVLEARQTLATIYIRQGRMDLAKAELEEIANGEIVAIEQAALGSLSKPADWNLRRADLEGATELLAAIHVREGRGDLAAPILLGRRGLARIVRLRQRYGLPSLAQAYDLEALRSRLRPDETLAAVVSLRTDFGVKTARPWTLGWGDPQAYGMLLGLNTERLIHLGAFEALSEKAAAWRSRLGKHRLEGFAPLAPLLSALPRTGPVYWIGEGVFEAWPIAALLSPGRQIVHLNHIHPRPEARAGHGVLAVVSDAFADGPAPKPHVKGELSFLEGKGGLETLVGPQATTSHVLQALAGGWSQIHLVAHGEAGEVWGETDDPYDDAWLRLSDGDLRAGEITDLDLRTVDLTVISACSTGRGIDQRNEGAASLASAFQDAGANSVVASNWPVPDKSTARFMALFYAAEGTPAQALADAARACALEGLSPAVWSAWSMFGWLRAG